MERMLETIIVVLKQRIVTYCKSLADLSVRLQKVAEEMKKLHVKTSKIRLGASIVGVAGGVTSVVAGVATIMTMGALTPLVVGITAGTTAAATGITGAVVQARKNVTEGKQVKEMNDQLAKCRNDMADLLELMNSLKDNPCIEVRVKQMIIATRYLLEGETKINESADQFGVAAMVGNTTQTVGAGITVGKCVEKAVVGPTLAGVGKVTGAFGIVFGVVGVGIDIFQIVDSSLDLSKENPSEASQRFIEIAKLVDQQRKSINEIWSLAEIYGQ